MLHRSFQIIAPILLIIISVIAVSACSGTGSPSPAEVPEPSYAGQIAENMLLALNDNDYVSFIRDFDNTMKNAVSNEVFNTQFVDNIKGKIGKYTPDSRQFFQAANQAQYTIVVYSAQYDDEAGAVLVQITFQQIDGKPYIAGLLWNSPELRGE
jgi:hypothetical protein